MKNVKEKSISPKTCPKIHVTKPRHNTWLNCNFIFFWRCNLNLSVLNFLVSTNQAIHHMSPIFASPKETVTICLRISPHPLYYLPLNLKQSFLFFCWYVSYSAQFLLINTFHIIKLLRALPYLLDGILPDSWIAQ